ncbi:thermonuclease family protein [Methylosoma difficile]
MSKIIGLFLLLISFSVFANEWSGVVVGISDGDTLTVLNEEKHTIKIRLAEIDAPESKQAFGTQSKQSLSDLCFKKTVIVDDKGRDKYKRTLGRIKCSGIDANLEQVKRGMAWAYKQYSTDKSIADLEDEAKALGIGLWADENPMPPWDFRHGGKKTNGSKQKNPVNSSSSSFECSGKSRCGDMGSCAEARFYLSECGMSRLDRDHDGIPCESICR